MPKDVRIFAPQDFSPWRKIPQIPKYRITHMVTSNGGHPHHHYKALWQAVQLPLQQKNHQFPNLHTVAASLHTVVHPPSGLLGHLFPPQQTEYSHIWLSMFWVCPDPEPAPPACFVLLMLSVAAAKIHFEEQAIVVGINKEGRPTRQLGLAALLCPLLSLALWSGFFAN